MDLIEFKFKFDSRALPNCKQLSAVALQRWVTALRRCNVVRAATTLRRCNTLRAALLRAPLLSGVYANALHTALLRVARRTALLRITLRLRVHESQIKFAKEVADKVVSRIKSSRGLSARGLSAVAD